MNLNLLFNGFCWLFFSCSYYLFIKWSKKKEFKKGVNLDLNKNSPQIVKDWALIIITFMVAIIYFFKAIN